MKRIIGIMLAVMLALTAGLGALAESAGMLRRGDAGEEVRKLQERLIELNYLEGGASGSFDEATEKALLLFQRRNVLLETGMADEVTLRVLYSEGAEKWVKPSEIVYETEEYTDGLYCYEATCSSAMGMGAAKSAAWDMPEFNTDEYSFIRENGFQSVITSPLSTFAADVDTSSYAQLRRRILAGEKVPQDSVRIEEMLNYFSYSYKAPEGDEPLGVTMELAPCPWNGETRLLQIGLQAAEVTEEKKAPLHLVFLIDTSGSMEGVDRLDLVKRAFLLLLDSLGEKDTVSIVTYASQDRVVLEGVPATEKTRIMEAISDLSAGGATNGSAGILRAYEIAEKYLPEGGTGRILLATDGDLNVGTTSEADLARLVTEKKKTGIGLTCLGFGMGNYKDNKMEALADYGDGNCWYIDNIYEARKALVTEGGGTFRTVAKDVKLQVDFNPAKIKGYRLIGYEDRLLAAEDFADDTVDGGEIGSGHRVTALYEIVPADSSFDFGGVESKYAQGAENAPQEGGEWLTLNIRAKEPEGDESRLYTYPLTGEVSEELSDNMKFAAAVAETGMLLRQSEWAGNATYSAALKLLRDCGAVSGDAYKEEFLYMVTLLERAGEISKTE